MAQSINPSIYTALFVTPAYIHTQGEASALGDTEDDTTYVVNCYAYEHRTKVLNELGQEVISGLQLYMKGDDIIQIDMHSKVTCATAVRTEILARETFRGRDGAQVIGVLYLP